MKKNVLVFPCGSEIGLEVYRSLKHSTHFNLIGANSVEDHGRFVFENYIGDLPFINSGSFIPAMKRLVKELAIDIIYPAMDSVIALLKEHEEELGCPVVGSPAATTAICLSKKETYRVLDGVVRVPATFEKEEVDSYPVFVKPVVGYGSRGARKITNAAQLTCHLEEYPDSVITEFLPGEEYTVDCFTDREGRLLFSGARLRNRISNGISVNTRPVESGVEEFEEIARTINRKLTFRGAWFVQLKRDADNKLCLLEVASRLGGSSSLFRNKGVNFAQMSLFDLLEIPVSVIENRYSIEMDRALDNKYKLGISYNEVYIDFDDCLFLEKQFYNTDVMAFLFTCFNKGIKISVLSRHRENLTEKLDKLHISFLFDKVLHLTNGERKSDYITNPDSIFIDDSFAERKEVALQKGIPVFGLDMIECLI